MRIEEVLFLSRQSKAFYRHAECNNAGLILLDLTRSTSLSERAGYHTMWSVHDTMQ
jgi:hypothetical protein